MKQIVRYGYMTKVAKFRTYLPSGRLDSGMTRSRVRGSRAMPAAVLSGLIGGRDIAKSIRG